MKTSTIHLFLFTIGVVTYKTLAYESQEYYYYDYDSNGDFGDAAIGDFADASIFATPPVGTSWNQPSRSQGSGSSAGFASGQLQKHNSYRARHGSPPMRLDSNMNAAAESYAKRLASAGTMDMVHSGVSGENLFVWCDSNGGGGEKATDDWYDEKRFYNFGNPGGNSWQTGHFTQVVWKASTRLGIGKAVGWVDGLPCEFVVGRYSPAGNVGGQYRANVARG